MPAIRLTSILPVLIMMCCAFGFVMPISAQKETKAKEVTTTMSLGDRNGFSIFIAEGTRKEVEEVLVDFLKQYDKKPQSEKSAKQELKIDDIIITSIQATPLDLYFLFDENKGGVTVTCFFDMGSSFLSSQVYPDQFQKGLMFMERFAKRVEKVRLEALVKDADNEYNKLVKEKESLEKEKARLEKTIADCEATIATSKDELGKNASQTGSNKEQLSAQESKLSTLKKDLEAYTDY